MLKTHDFYYTLPEKLIAQTPLADRSASRLMTLDRTTGEIGHRHFYEIAELLRPGDCLVLNNSRVLPARLLGHRVPTGGAVEVSAVVRSAENVCIVPKSAVAREGETSYVLVAERGRLRRRDVVVMMEQGADAAISAGLGAGERVVCSPEGWKEGQRVQE